MTTSGPLWPPAGSGRHDLLKSPQALLDTTFDQLRTLVAVHETGTALGAARVLGREQSSVQKQLDTMNRNFRELCGETLVEKQGRGKNVRFTSTGQALVELARSTLGGWLGGIDEYRRRRGETLVIGSTRFTLGYLMAAVERVADELVHVRTRDLVEAVRDKVVDLVCGSVVTTEGHDERLAGLDVMEWRRSGLSLLTNLPAGQLPGPSVPASELHTLPLVVPTSGLITQCITGWFGADYRERLDIVAEIDSIDYGIELLHSGPPAACLPVTRGVGEATEDGRMPEGRGLRVLDVINDLQPRLDVLVGAFTRRAERSAQPPTHPLRLLWQALADEDARHKSLSLNPFRGQR
jgi:DNA-binding transcriptional LysR family regulator